jgi:hypothetical protein
MAKGGGSLKIYKYFISIHYVACLAPIDFIKEIRFDDKTVFAGTQTDGTLYIDKPDLYGGEDREGGVIGNITTMLGKPSQTVNSVIAAKFGNVPAFRSVISILLDDVYIGMNYYLKPFSIIATRINSTNTGTPPWQAAYIEPIPGQMNGVHIIRDLLVNTYTGLGISTSEIDETTFAAAAQTTFNEGYGFTFFFAEGKSIDEAIKTVKAHINAEVYKDRLTNKYKIKLIREDYNIGSLLTLDKTNVSSISELKRTLLGELFSKVIIQFIDGTTYKDAIETLEDFTLSAKQGGAVEKNIEFKGCRTRSLAAKLAIREAGEVGTPVFAGIINCNRIAENLNPGDVVKIAADCNEYLDTDLICRVAKINLGTGTDNKIVINFVQDVFTAQEPVVFYGNQTLWTDIASDPIPVVHRIVQELPYYIYAKAKGDLEGKNIPVTDTYIAIAAVQPTLDSQLAGIWTGGKRRTNVLAFCPWGQNTNTMDRITTTLTIKNGTNLAIVKLNTFVQVGQELMGIISRTANVFTVIRGVLDTVPVAHSIDEECYFWQELNGTDFIPYFLGETVNIRLTPRTAKKPVQELAYADAPQDSITVIGRIHRPYPPGNVQVNALSWPSTIIASDLVLTWTSRNRFQQTLNLIDWYYGNITSEPGVTYSGELRRADTNALLFSFTGEVGLTRTFNTLVPLPGVISSISFVNYISTFTMSTAHGLSTGIAVYISGNSAYNSIYIVTVISSTIFTVTTVGDYGTGTMAVGTTIAESSIYIGNVIVNLWSVNSNGDSFQTVSHTLTLN